MLCKYMDLEANCGYETKWFRKIRYLTLAKSVL